ncbi:hypothetical protein V7x_18420 [Crateriforma conspicua]|uniref:Uncharacterized protein n=1 Tax=Crateriforma conspicua TaxID=2527996 RepID=A0A5C6FTS3_9PLAN|nr:hypothetical protein V7x_18420 [Crateriforma conspicua]
MLGISECHRYGRIPGHRRDRVKHAAPQQPFVYRAAGATATASPDAARRSGRSVESGEGLVRDAQREISDIVREVAAAATAQMPESRYWAFLADRILRAMAAEGVTVWRKASVTEFDVCHRLGNVDFQDWSNASRQSHQCMLHEIAAGAGPAVVPSTPGATDPEQPANPSPHPVAVVAIDTDMGESSGSDPTYLIEVHLESGGGTVTHRGYLRFVAQMADLAGEFMRRQLIRRLRDDAKLSDWIDQQFDRWSRLSDPRSVIESLADSVAEGFDLDRVAVVRRERPREVIAVSHVDQVDRHSEAVRWILQQSLQTPVDDNGCYFDLDRDVGDGDGEDESLVLDCLIRVGTASDLALIGLRKDNHSGCAEEHRGHLIRLCRMAGIAIDIKTKATKRSLLGRWLAPSGAMNGSWYQRYRRQWMTGLGTLAAIVVAAMPVPNIVTSPAVLRPQQWQSVCSPRNAVVDAIYVRHNDRVEVGDPLLTLKDETLEQQIKQLRSERLRLEAELAVETENLIHPSADRSAARSQANSRRRVTELRIDGIDAQLEHLRSVEASLHVTAKQSGIVDAWRLRQRLIDRPVRFGEPLLKVVQLDTAWNAEAEVDQRRMGDLMCSGDAGELSVAVSPVAQPDVRWDATVKSIGPAVESESGSATLVQLALPDHLSITEDATAAASQGSLASVASPARTDAVGNAMASENPVATIPHEGMPVRVRFHCGTSPLAYVLFRDAIDSVRSFWGLHFGTPKKTEAST